MHEDPADQQWDRLVRDSLAAAGDQAPRSLHQPSPARARRRRTGVVALAAAATAGVVVVALAVPQGAGSGSAEPRPSDRSASPVEPTPTVTPDTERTRAVGYGGMSVRVPANMALNDLDGGGYPRSATVVLPPGGAGFSGGQDTFERVLSVWFTGEPLPAANLGAPERVLLRSGTTGTLRRGPAEAGFVRSVLDVDGAGQVVIDAPDTPADARTAERILDSVALLRAGERGSTPVGYDSVVVDMPADWRVNAVGCGTPQADTVVPGEWGIVPACLAPRPDGITDVRIESRDDVPLGEQTGLDHEEVLPSGIRVEWGVHGYEDYGTTDRLQKLTVVVPDFDVVVTAHAADLTEAWDVIRTLRPADTG